MNEMPSILHKYRDLSGEGLELVRKAIITKQLWFSRPADFNDPFDCAPVVDTTWDRTGINKVASRVAAKRVCFGVRLGTT